MSRFLAAFAAVAIMLSGCGARGGGNAEWAGVQQRFTERFFERNPEFAASQGKHEFDGRLPDWSEEGSQRRSRSCADAIAEAEAMSGLSDEQDYRARLSRRGRARSVCSG